MRNENNEEKMVKIVCRETKEVVIEVTLDDFYEFGIDDEMSSLYFADFSSI